MMWLFSTSDICTIPGFPLPIHEKVMSVCFLEADRAKKQIGDHDDDADGHYEENKAPHDLILFFARQVVPVAIGILRLRRRVWPGRARLLKDRARLLEGRFLHVLVKVRVQVFLGLAWPWPPAFHGRSVWAGGGTRRANRLLLWLPRGQRSQRRRVTQLVAIGGADDRGSRQQRLQILAHLLRGLIPLAGVGFERLDENLLKLGRETRIQCPDRRKLERRILAGVAIDDQVM